MYILVCQRNIIPLVFLILSVVVIVYMSQVGSVKHEVHVALLALEIVFNTVFGMFIIISVDNRPRLCVAYYPVCLECSWFSTSGWQLWAERMAEAARRLKRHDEAQIEAAAGVVYAQVSVQRVSGSIFQSAQMVLVGAVEEIVDV